MNPLINDGLQNVTDEQDLAKKSCVVSKEKNGRRVLNLADNVDPLCLGHTSCGQWRSAVYKWLHQ